MMRRLIDLFLDRPWLVLAACAVLIVPGVNSLLNIPIDAFPDLTNNQVSIVTSAPGMAAVEVEQLVAFPIESAMMGIPNTQEVRSISKLGLAIVTVIFDDDVPPLQARQLVNERILDARSSLPAEVVPQMGLLATPFGEAFQYILRGLHQLGALAYERMATPRLRCVNGAGDGKDLAALFRRHSGGDQRTRRQRRLDHESALREAGDDAVALGEIGGQRWRAQGVFADQHPVGCDAVGQVKVLAGVDAIQPGAHHRNGGGCCLRKGVGGHIQSTFMGCRIHTQCEPRDDGEARPPQCARKKPRVVRALCRGVAAADHGQAPGGRKRVLRKQPGRPHQVHEQRGIFGVQQRLGIPGIPQCDHRTGRSLWICPLQPMPGGLQQRLPSAGYGTQRLGLGQGHTVLQGRFGLAEDVLRQPKTGQQAPRGAIANARGKREAQPSAQLVAVHGGS